MDAEQRELPRVPRKQPDLIPTPHVTRGVPRRDGLDLYTFLLHRQGLWRADAGAQEIASAPGRVCVLDFAYPALTEVTWNDSITISLPRAVIDEVLPGRTLHGLTLDGTRGGLLHDFLGALVGRARGLSVADGPYLVAACRDLIAACVAPSADSAARAQPQLDGLVYHRARALIDASLARPEWDAEALRLALGVSRSTLYRVFKRFGGVAGHIRTRRLANARACCSPTCGPDGGSRRSAAPAGSPATRRSAAVRQQYGYTAREVQAFSGPALFLPVGTAPTTPVNEVDVIDWIRQLGG